MRNCGGREQESDPWVHVDLEPEPCRDWPGQAELALCQQAESAPGPEELAWGPEQLALAPGKLVLVLPGFAPEDKVPAQCSQEAAGHLCPRPGAFWASLGQALADE